MIDQLTAFKIKQAKFVLGPGHQAGKSLIRRRNTNTCDQIQIISLGKRSVNIANTFHVQDN